MKKEHVELAEEMHRIKMELASILGNLSVQVDACRNAEFLFKNLVVEGLDDANSKLRKLVYGK